MYEMSHGEWRAFVLERPRTAKLAVTRRDGRPHVTPVWIDMDGDRVVFTTHSTSVKGRAIRRDGRVAICLDDEAPPFAFVLIEGNAVVDDDPAEKLRWATRIGGRYMGAERAEEYGRRNAVEDELLVRVTPARVVARGGVAD